MDCACGCQFLEESPGFPLLPSSASIHRRHVSHRKHSLAQNSGGSSSSTCARDTALSWSKDVLPGNSSSKKRKIASREKTAKPCTTGHGIVSSRREYHAASPLFERGVFGSTAKGRFSTELKIEHDFSFIWSTGHGTVDDTWSFYRDSKLA